INLIEFWTGNNLVGLNEYNEKGEYVKSMKYQDEEVKLTFSEYGAKLAMEVKKGDTNETFFAFRNQPNKIFKEVNGKMKEIEISSQTVGSKMILKMAEAGKLQSSKVVDVKDFQAIEKRYAAEVQ
ncbi:MAG: hypothetical protein HUU45_10035, partial [Leptospiraceae bacterium]|nr:hypothetical protein [Leptospiraceae bacterium]